MTQDELRDYVVLTEQKYELLGRRFEAALNLLRLFAEEDDDTEEQRDEIRGVLRRYKFDEPSAQYSITELAGPEIEAISGLHLEMIRAARAYYAALDSGVDPGPAEEYLDGLTIIRSEDPAWLVHREYLFDRAMSMMEMQRLVAKVEP